MHVYKYIQASAEKAAREKAEANFMKLADSSSRDLAKAKGHEESLKKDLVGKRKVCVCVRVYVCVCVWNTVLRTVI